MSTTLPLLYAAHAARRVQCPGSHRMEAKYKSKEKSQLAKEGDAAHEIAKFRLMSGSCENFTAGSIAGNGEIITQEMVDGANLYGDFIEGIALGIKSRTMSVQKDIPVRVENPVDMSTINPQCRGIPDCWFYSDVFNELHVFDYKFGHKYVEVISNWQLIEYAIGAFNELSKQRKINLDNLLINLHIVQPRSFHRDGPIRSWQIIGNDLQRYLRSLHLIEAEALEPKAICITGSECSTCAARHACPVLQQSALIAIEIAEYDTPWELSNNELGNELRLINYAIERLEARKTGLEEQALSLIKSGKNILHFVAEESRGREQWTKTAEEIAGLGEILGVCLTKPIEVVTPKQAIKVGMPEGLVKDASTILRGAIKLAPENLLKIKKAFKL